MTEPQVDSLDEELFIFLRTIKEDVARLFKKHGLRTDQVFILELVDRGLSHPKEIVEALQWEPPLLSHYLSRLEKQGLITRQPDAHDRRRTIIRLSDKGYDVLQTARQSWREYTRAAFAGMGPAEIEALRRLTRRLASARENVL